MKSCFQWASDVKGEPSLIISLIIIIGLRRSVDRLYARPGLSSHFEKLPCSDLRKELDWLLGYLEVCHFTLNFSRAQKKNVVHSGLE